jgi:hypothetical protein
MLATSAEPIQRRLQSAAVSALTRLVPTDFSEPGERELFDRIRSAITKLNAPGPGYIRASATAMSDDVAEGVAQDVVDPRGLVLRRTGGRPA